MIALASQSRMSSMVMPLGPCRRPFDAEAVELRYLNSPAQIASILHLRDEIDLSAQTGANFLALEKKETSWALS